MITFAELFSTWIFIWFLLYYFKIVSYSPKFWLIFITIYAILSVIYMIYLSLIPMYIAIVFLLLIISKIIPLYSIRKDEIKKNDIVFGILLGLIYLGWLYYKNVNVFTIYFVYMFNYNMPFYKSIQSMQSIKL